MWESTLVQGGDDAHPKRVAGPLLFFLDGGGIGVQGGTAVGTGTAAVGHARGGGAVHWIARQARQVVGIDQKVVPEKGHRRLHHGLILTDQKPF